MSEINKIKVNNVSYDINEFKDYDNTEKLIGKIDGYNLYERMFVSDWTNITSSARDNYMEIHIPIGNSALFISSFKTRLILFKNNNDDTITIYNSAAKNPRIETSDTWYMQLNGNNEYELYNYNVYVGDISPISDYKGKVYVVIQYINPDEIINE